MKRSLKQSSFFGSASNLWQILKTNSFEDHKSKMGDFVLLILAGTRFQNSRCPGCSESSLRIARWKRLSDRSSQVGDGKGSRTNNQQLRRNHSPLSLRSSCGNWNTNECLASHFRSCHQCHDHFGCDSESSLYVFRAYHIVAFCYEMNVVCIVHHACTFTGKILIVVTLNLR